MAPFWLGLAVLFEQMNHGYDLKNGEVAGTVELRDCPSEPIYPALCIELHGSQNLPGFSSLAAPIYTTGSSPIAS